VGEGLSCRENFERMRKKKRGVSVFRKEAKEGYHKKSVFKI